jgi:hypothetical protein
MKNCKKCLASGMRVHILGSGFCQECQSDLEWKNAPRIHKGQMEKKARIQYYEKGEEYVKRKWKDKYGDASAEEVASYR